ncbi:MAG: hypothetical protein HC905_32300 [Bacteroidales bacterium]|nr:hypothetical protein [Bacteroidales bacterium]
MHLQQEFSDYDKIIIHDPWLPLCTGSSAYVPYGVFNTSATTYSVTSPITYNFHQVLGVIHGIQKKDNIIAAKVASIQNIPEPEPPKNSFTIVFRENAERIIGSKQERYSDAEITSKVKQEAYYRNEVQFIYPSALLNSRFNLQLSSVVAPNQILDVVSTGVLPNFITTFEKKRIYGR